MSQWRQASRSSSKGRPERLPDRAGPALTRLMMDFLRRQQRRRCGPDVDAEVAQGVAFGDASTFVICLPQQISECGIPSGQGQAFS